MQLETVTINTTSTLSNRGKFPTTEQLGLPNVTVHKELKDGTEYITINAKILTDDVNTSVFLLGMMIGQLQIKNLLR